MIQIPLIVPRSLKKEGFTQVFILEGGIAEWGKLKYAFNH